MSFLNLLKTPETTLAIYDDRSISYAAHTLWNKPPEECRLATIRDCFTPRLNTHVLKQAYDI